MATYQVTDPSGKVHTRNSSTRVYTHALIRQNKADYALTPEQHEDTHYFVNWFTSQANAEREGRVLAHLRSYVAVVEL